MNAVLTPTLRDRANFLRSSLIDSDLDGDSDESEEATPEPRTKYTFAEALRSPKFIYLIIFCAILILRLNFVVMTLNAQLAFFFDAATTKRLSLIFSTLLPLGGLAAPLTALLLDKYRAWSYRVCLVLSIIYGICLAVPNVPCQIVAYVIISVSRQLTYSIVFCMTSSLFGQEHLGKLLASNNAVVFLVGLFQYPIAMLAGNSWSYVDLFMAAIALPLFCSNGGL